MIGGGEGDYPESSAFHLLTLFAFHVDTSFEELQAVSCGFFSLPNLRAQFCSFGELYYRLTQNQRLMKETNAPHLNVKKEEEHQSMIHVSAI